MVGAIIAVVVLVGGGWYVYSKYFKGESVSQIESQITGGGSGNDHRPPTMKN